MFSRSYRVLLVSTVHRSLETFALFSRLSLSELTSHGFEIGSTFSSGNTDPGEALLYILIANTHYSSPMIGFIVFFFSKR